MADTDDQAVGSGEPTKFRHCDDCGQPASPGIGHSIRPGTAAPPTVLISEMGDGALYLAGWRAGPSAFLVAADATGLRRELARAFGGEDVAVRTDHGGAL
jgi:hypothetical protein